MRTLIEQILKGQVPREILPFIARGSYIFCEVDGGIMALSEKTLKPELIDPEHHEIINGSPTLIMIETDSPEHISLIGDIAHSFDES